MGSQSSTAAKQQYIAKVTELHPEWMQLDNTKQGSQPAGPVISSLAGADVQEMVCACDMLVGNALQAADGPSVCGMNRIQAVCLMRPALGT